MFVITVWYYLKCTHAFVLASLLQFMKTSTLVSNAPQFSEQRRVIGDGGQHLGGQAGGVAASGFPAFDRIDTGAERLGHLLLLDDKTRATLRSHRQVNR